MAYGLFVSEWSLVTIRLCITALQTFLHFIFKLEVLYIMKIEVIFEDKFVYIPTELVMC